MLKYVAPLIAMGMVIIWEFGIQGTYDKQGAFILTIPAAIVGFCIGALLDHLILKIKEDEAATVAKAEGSITSTDVRAQWEEARNKTRESTLQN